jgi:general secretion pathway protein H
MFFRLVPMDSPAVRGKMRTSVAGSSSRPAFTPASVASVAGPLLASKREAGGVSNAGNKRSVGGFTLLELLVVIVIMAVATAGVSLSLRSSSGTQLEREAQRLAALFESARAQSRMSATAVSWHTTPSGFTFEGLSGSALPSTWLGNDVRVTDSKVVVLGPEPIIQPQQIRLASISEPDNSVQLVTDGVRPFSVQPSVAIAPQ